MVTVQGARGTKARRRGFGHRTNRVGVRGRFLGEHGTVFEGVQGSTLGV